MVLAQARMESRLMVRNGEQLLLAVVIPVLVLIGMVRGADRLGLDYDHPVVDVVTPGVLALAVLLGTAAFASLGLLVAGALRAEATLAVANLVYVLLAAGGAVLLPASAYGGWGRLATYLPSGALGSGLRECFLRGTFPLAQSVVLLVWAAVGTLATVRTFQWE
jgi:ABC-2 type transport system permease protein